MLRISSLTFPAFIAILSFVGACNAVPCDTAELWQGDTVDETGKFRVGALRSLVGEDPTLMHFHVVDASTGVATRLNNSELIYTLSTGAPRVIATPGSHDGRFSIPRPRLEAGKWNVVLRFSPEATGTVTTASFCHIEEELGASQRNTDDSQRP